jgi:hypothetical protein
MDINPDHLLNSTTHLFVTHFPSIWQLDEVASGKGAEVRDALVSDNLYMRWVHDLKDDGFDSVALGEFRGRSPIIWREIRNHNEIEALCIKARNYQCV